MTETTSRSNVCRACAYVWIRVDRCVFLGNIVHNIIVHILYDARAKATSGAEILHKISSACVRNCNAMTRARVLEKMCSFDLV